MVCPSVMRRSRPGWKRRLTSVCAGHRLVEPPGGIEPPTPSLPWISLSPLCAPRFPQVAGDCRPPSYVLCRGGPSRPSTRSVLQQILVDGANGHGALPGGASHALDRAVAHVAGGEHARQAGLERQRRTVQGPGWLGNVAPGQDEPAVVELQDVAKPASVRLGTD